jgi:hypothetical protein
VTDAAVSLRFENLIEVDAILSELSPKAPKGVLSISSSPPVVGQALENYGQIPTRSPQRLREPASSMEWVS